MNQRERILADFQLHQVQNGQLAPEEVDKRAFLLNTRVDPDGELVRPRMCLKAGEDRYGYPIPVLTFGNISMVMGAEKVGKSFFKTLLIASAIGGKANNYSDRFTGVDMEDRDIVILDTEQDLYYATINHQRIERMVGGRCGRLTSYALRELGYKEKAMALEAVFEVHPSVGLIFIDGYVDMVGDFNDLREAKEFTEKLMQLSSRHACHISGVLHVNPGTQKGRGHLGTIMQQKCETIIEISKPDNIKVVCHRSRGRAFEDFELVISEHGLPMESQFKGLSFL